jgi:hypothetical protein
MLIAGNDRAREPVGFLDKDEVSFGVAGYFCLNLAVSLNFYFFKLFQIEMSKQSALRSRYAKE